MKEKALRTHQTNINTKMNDGTFKKSCPQCNSTEFLFTDFVLRTTEAFWSEAQSKFLVNSDTSDVHDCTHNMGYRLTCLHCDTLIGKAP